jgi:hypothetical protein
MAVKVYKTINPGNLSTVVKGVRISFKAGAMHLPGVYSTDNAELQKAIEAEPQYGQVFKLAFSGGNSAKKPKASDSDSGSSSSSSSSSMQEGV